MGKLVAPPFRTFVRVYASHPVSCKLVSPGTLTPVAAWGIHTHRLRAASSETLSAFIEVCALLPISPVARRALAGVVLPRARQATCLDVTRVGAHIAGVDRGGVGVIS